MDNIKKGFAYEKQIKTLLMNSGYKEVYLWNEITLNTFIKSKIFNSYSKKLNLMRKFNIDDKINIQDVGCDILCLNSNDEWIIVQCKNYTNTVYIDKLAGFYYMLLASKLNGMLYYTSELSCNATLYYLDQVKCIQENYINIEEENVMEEKYVKLISRDYQQECLNIINNSASNRKIIQLMCGMGKTLIAIKWS